MSDRAPGSARTNLPDWPVQPPAVDPTARAVAVLALDPEAFPVADAWCADLARLGVPLHRHDGAAGAADALATQLAGARVGWRLMLAGPEVDVLALRALALAGGAVEGEVACAVTSTAERLVRCVHCGTSTRTTEPPRGRVPCAGCGHVLVVHAHLSRRHAAHLGTRAPDEPG